MTRGALTVALVLAARAAGLAHRCRRSRTITRRTALPPDVTDPTDNLPAGWEVYDDGGKLTYYNPMEDEYTDFHPFYEADVDEADVAVDKLAAADELFMRPALGGRVDAALSALDGAPPRDEGPPASAPEDDDAFSAWDEPESVTPKLGGRVDAALDSLWAEPEAYTPPLGGRVDAALDEWAAPAETSDWSSDESGSGDWGETSDWGEGATLEAAPADAAPGPADLEAAAEKLKAAGVSPAAADRAMDLFTAALSDEERDTLRENLDGNDEAVLDGDDTPVDAALTDEEAEDLVDLLNEDYAETYEWTDDRIGEVDSHELIEVDEDGDPITTASTFTFIDEATCVGCTMCATIAPNTFMMTDDHGRARSFNQEGDDDETVREAIGTCPVSCIHFVPWDELVSLERSRAETMLNYNFKARLVGNDGFNAVGDGGMGQSQEISTNSMLRCNSCPTNECADCPMFGVGDRVNGAPCGNCPTNGCLGCPLATEYPEFSKRRARRDRKRRQLIKARKEEAAEELGLSNAATEL